MAALITDALRAQYLEREGYDTQILEFIDMEHTPKNILIRAVRSGKRRENQEALRRCEEYLHVSPTLGRLLEEKGWDGGLAVRGENLPGKLLEREGNDR